MAIFELVKRKRVTDRELLEMGPEFSPNKTGKVLPLLVLMAIFAMLLMYFWPMLRLI
jgi:hypothetical protein